MKKIIIVCLLILPLASCRTAKRNIPVTPIIITDSVIERVEYIETLRLDTVLVEVSVPTQSVAVTTFEGNSHLETDFAKSDAWINPDGSLGHTLDNIEQTFKPSAVVPVVDSHANTEKEKIKEVPVPYPEPFAVEKKLTKWQSFKLGSFWGLVSLCFILGFVIFRKPIFSVMRKWLKV